MTIELLAAALSLLGAPLVASVLARRRAWGFLAWLGSNALWIWWAILGSHWGFLVTQAFFSATSLAGWWRNRTAVGADDVQVVIVTLGRDLRQAEQRIEQLTAQRDAWRVEAEHERNRAAVLHTDLRRLRMDLGRLPTEAFNQE